MFLSRAKYWITCTSCKCYSIADRDVLMTNGAIGAGILAIPLFMLSNDLMNDRVDWKWLIPLIFLIAALIGFYQSKTVKLSISKEPTSTTEKSRLKKRKVVSKENPVEYLKYEYQDYSQTELLKIASGKGYRKDAVTAAKELLKENYDA